MRRLIAVGDIHGMSQALNDLLVLVEPRADDEFVFLGDYINRGPDSAGVITQLLKFTTGHRCTFVMGNHEEMLMAATLGKTEYAYWMKFGGKETLKSYGIPAPYSRPVESFNMALLPEGHPLFFANMVNYYEDKHHIFVHAGCLPGRPMTQQIGDDLRWNTPLDDLKHMSGKTVVCGHSPRKTVQKHAALIRVDTGAGIWPHGRLSAIDMLSGKVWSVPAGLPVAAS